MFGPNGAGKTTTLRILMGSNVPAASPVSSARPVSPSCPELLHVGAMVEQAAFVPHLSGMGNLRLWWEAGGARLSDADVEGALASPTR